MGNVVKKITFIILVLFFTALFIWVINFIFHKTILAQDSQYITSGIGAFFGAFFAFLFLIIQSGFGRIYQRKLNHRNALVKHERMLNEYFNIAGDNGYVAEGFIEAIDNGGLYIPIFVPFEVNKELLIEIAHIDYVNDMFELNAAIAKTKQAMEVITDGYNQLKASLLTGSIDKVTFDANTKGFCRSGLVKLKIVLEDLDKKTEDLFVKNKFLYKKSISTIDWFLGLFVWQVRYPRDFEKFCEPERKKIIEGRRQMKEHSIQEIEDRARRINEQRKKNHT